VLQLYSWFPQKRFSLGISAGCALKMERVWQCSYANRHEARCDMADYIVSFYNCTRLHSKLGYLPPAAYEQKMAVALPGGVSEKT